jgi:UDP-N-acetylglucosamine transferase subunit ALG13
MSAGTFVSVGNAVQPFHRLIDAVIGCLGALPQPVFVQSGRTPCRTPECTTQQFVGIDEYERRIRGAALLVLHAGAGSVIHAIQSGKVPVVMPRLRRFGEAIDDHQAEYVSLLAKAGKVVVIETAAELEPAAARAMQMQQGLPHEPRSTAMLAALTESLARYARHSR